MVLDDVVVRSARHSSVEIEQIVRALDEVRDVGREVDDREVLLTLAVFSAFLVRAAGEVERLC